MYYLVALLVSLILPGSYAHAETLSFENGVYEGEVLNGVPHGEGTFSFSDGASYVGELKDGLKHGSGTFISGVGEKYVGQFREDRYHGQGVYTWPNGQKYVGEFRDGRPWLGTTFLKNGEVKGYTRNGVFHAIAFDCTRGAKKVVTLKLRGRVTQREYEECIYPDGAIYLGPWKGQAKHGIGQYQYAGGSVYQGRFHFDKATGYGKVEWPDGSSQDGFFLDGQPYGVTRYRWSNGEEQLGVMDGAFINSFYFDSANQVVSVLNQGQIDTSKKLISVEHNDHIFVGQVDEDAFNGLAIIMSRNSIFEGDGSLLIGEFENNIPHGYGVSVASDDLKPLRIFVGDFKDGVAYNGNVFSEVWEIQEVIIDGARKPSVTE